MPANVISNYFAGREFADTERARGYTNQLRAQDVRAGQQFENLAHNPNATPDQYARIGRSDVSNALVNQERQGDERKQQLAGRLLLASQYALQSQSPKAFVEQNFPELVQHAGPAWATATDDQVRTSLQGVAAKFGAQAGVGPAAPEPQFQQMQGPNGSVIVRRGDKWQVIEAPKAEKPPAAFRPMRPEEVQAAGLPPGTAAQVNDSTGQISVLSKRDATAGLSQKDQVIAKQKLTTVNLARQQLQNIQQRFNAIKGSLVAGAGGQGSLPTPKGQAFDRAVDQMRSTLTALTRVPGVGAMSDFETKLDQAKFPSRTDYEEVTQQQIDDIGMMLRTVEDGYKGLLSGETPAAPEQPEAPDLSGLSDEDLLRALSGG